MTFILDPRLASSSLLLIDWKLCQVLLKNDCTYPWLILVPRQAGVREIHELSPDHRVSLIEEISRLSHIVQIYFKPDKINVAALGNRVSQLHIHIVARYKEDPAWPYSIWQPQAKESPYDTHSFALLGETLRGLLQ